MVSFEGSFLGPVLLTIDVCGCGLECHLAPPDGITADDVVWLLESLHSIPNLAQIH